MTQTPEQQKIFQSISDRLASLTPPKRWMTARSLSRYLNENLNLSTTAGEIEELLINSMEPSSTPKIRYSYYPSRKTLDILWGHTDVVGQQKVLPALERSDTPEDAEPINLPEHAPFVFLSHNHRDARHVMELRRMLARNDIGVWVFEQEIEQGDRIIEQVRSAIHQCDFFAMYLTRHSLGSLWVKKELEQAQIHRQPFIIVDGSDMEFLRVVQSYSEWGKGNASLLNNLANSTAPTKSARLNWLNRYEDHASHLNELADTFYTWPHLSPAMEKPIGRYKFSGITDFVEQALQLTSDIQY